MVEFGEQLRRAREAKGMTQQSLAEKLYVTRQAVSRWECGDRFPDLKMAQQISVVLEVSLDDLLSGNEMEKVVERNPVIEKPLANNCLIALYACIALYTSVKVVDIVVRLFAANLSVMGYGMFQTVVTELIGLAMQAAVFSYGFVTALKGMLSPKRMGFVIVVFFTSMLLLRSHAIFGIFQRNEMKTPFVGLILSAVAVIPAVAGAVSAYLFFVKAKSEKIWRVFIILCACLGITGTIGNMYASIVKEASHLLSLNDLLVSVLLSGYVVSICKYVLIIYQTSVLQKKRLKVKTEEIKQEK